MDEYLLVVAESREKNKESGNLRALSRVVAGRQEPCSSSRDAQGSCLGSELHSMRAVAAIDGNGTKNKKKRRETPRCVRNDRQGKRMGDQQRMSDGKELAKKSPR